MIEDNNIIEPAGSTGLSQAKLEQRFMADFGPLFTLERDSGGERAAIIASLRYRWLPAGTVLMEEGVACRQLPFVLSGSIRVYKLAESGREISLYRIAAGQSCILSSGCGFGRLNFPAIAVAEQDTAAAFLPASAVRRLLDASATFRSFVLEQYATRLSDVIELVEEVAFRHVDQRLYEYMQSHARTLADGFRELRATHRELADHIGSSREVVSRILKDWEDRQCVALGRGTIRLLEAFATLVF